MSIAHERSAEDARGVMLDLSPLNKSHLPSSSRLLQAGKQSGSPTLGCPCDPQSLYLPLPPQPPHPFLLTLAKPLCMLIGGGLIQFAAVVDQWWITFPSFGSAPLAQGGGRTCRRKQRWSGAAVPRDNVRLCSPVSPLFPFCSRITIMFSQTRLFVSWMALDCNIKLQ